MNNNYFEVNPSEFPSGSINLDDLRVLTEYTQIQERIAKPNFFERLFKCGRAKSYKKYLKNYFKKV